MRDQTISENLIIGADDGRMGENKRLYFGSPVENLDPLWISRFDRGDNQTDLRVNVSDDNGDDRFVIGTTFWEDGLFHPYFIVQSNGRVGIGTQAVGDERLAVNGKIRAKEVKVESQNWDTPWPDYVFDKNYDLGSLPQLEQYIQKNHHLPEMPSQARIANEGVELGETSKLLLKKIEELTLHLIKMDKENKQLKASLLDMDQKLERNHIH